MYHDRMIIVFGLSVKFLSSKFTILFYFILQKYLLTQRTLNKLCPRKSFERIRMRLWKWIVQQIRQQMSEIIYLNHNHCTMYVIVTNNEFVTVLTA